MAQPQQTKKKPPQDSYAQQGKTLASAVQRLRGWIGSDPSRAPELADALVELTAHRLLGHSYSPAAEDAQDAVRRAAQLLTANGPIGPYTLVTDAARCIAALVHVATIQAAAGLPEAAGHTIESLHELHKQFREFRIKEQLLPQTAIWALCSSGRAALAAANVPEANAYADAALARLAGSGLQEDPAFGYLVIDVYRLAADARWAAGAAEESLGLLHAAKDGYDALVGGRLDDPGRLSPALLERLAEPLFGLYRDLADRLVATGDTDLGLVTRRVLVDHLQRLVKRLGEAARVQLASALADLAGDLLEVGRAEEAAQTATQAQELVGDGVGATPSRLLVSAVRARALTRVGRGVEAVALLRQVVDSIPDEPPTAGRALGLSALAEACQATGELTEAAAHGQTAARLSRGLVGPAVDEAALGAAVRDLARGVTHRGVPPVTWTPLTPAEAYAAAEDATQPRAQASAEATLQAETSAWLASQRVAAQRLEAERLAQARTEAEHREAEQARAERVAAQQQEAARIEAEQAELLEADRQAAAEEAERVARKQRREERLAAHQIEVEQREGAVREAQRLELERRLAAGPTEAERLELEQLYAELAEPAPEPVDLEPANVEPADAEPEVAQPDELTEARQRWEDARARGDRRAARAENERMVELLGPRAEADPDTYGPQLHDALVDLASARLRAGDLWGSRSATRQAKALARSLGR